MAGKGGYQAPAAPAPVSGPGALSRRTDGGPGAMQGAKYVSGLPYGEGQEFQDVQQMAPMSAAPRTRTADITGGAQAGQPLTLLNADTQRPSEPVTAGIDMGPGAGSVSSGFAMQDEAQNAAADASLAQYRPVLMYIASRSDVSADTRNLIRKLVG